MTTHTTSDNIVMTMKEICVMVHSIYAWSPARGEPDSVKFRIPESWGEEK